MLNKEKCAALDKDIKDIFDKIAEELADALVDIKRIEHGVTKEESRNLASRADQAIRRAGEICTVCGTQAQRRLQQADSN